MRLRLALLALVAVALAGCFTSPEPLVTAANAAYPFQSVVLRGEDGVDLTVAREGDVYTYGTEGDELDLMLQDFGDGFYLLQMADEPTDAPPRSLYAVIVVDTTANTISLYRTVVTPADFDNGIAHCIENGEEMFLGCLSDGQQLIDLVKAAIGAGEMPEGVFNIVTIN